MPNKNSQPEKSLWQRADAYCLTIESRQERIETLTLTDVERQQVRQQLRQIDNFNAYVEQFIGCLLS